MPAMFPIEILLNVAEYLDCEDQYALLCAAPFLASQLTYSRHLLAEADKKGNNLVHMLAQKGEEGLLKSLFPDKDLETSSTRGNNICRLKQMLLARSVNDNGATPLHLAAENGHLAVVEWISKRPDINLNSEDKSGSTCVEWAARAGRTEVVSLLLGNPDLTVDWNTNQRSNPLCLAAEHDHEATTRAILERHAHRININSQAAYGITALSLAVLRGHEAIIELLLQQKGVNVNAEDYLGNSTLHMAVRSKNHAALKCLLKHPDANPNVRDWYGHTPLQEAVCMADEAMVTLLLKHPATDVNLGNCKQATPLIKAVQESKGHIVALLLKRQDIRPDNKDHWGMTALSWAAFLGRVEIAKILLEREDVDPNSKDEDGLTPLSLSMQIGWEDMAEFLLEMPDVEVNATDNYGWTALAHAKNAPGSRSVPLMRLLLEHGATMKLYAEMTIIYSSLMGSDIAIEMVESMVEDQDLAAYMVKRFGKQRAEEAMADGRRGVQTLLFRDTRAERMRRDGMDGILYQEF